MGILLFNFFLNKTDVKCIVSKMVEDIFIGQTAKEKYRLIITHGLAKV